MPENWGVRSRFYGAYAQTPDVVGARHCRAPTGSARAFWLKNIICPDIIHNCFAKCLKGAEVTVDMISTN